MNANLQLQIDRLVLDGINLSPRQRRELQTQIEVELSRLLTENAAIPFDHNIAVPSLTIDAISPSHSPVQLGQQIAQNIYSSMSQGMTGQSS